MRNVIYNVLIGVGTYMALYRYNWELGPELAMIALVFILFLIFSGQRELILTEDTLICRKNLFLGLLGIHKKIKLNDISKIEYAGHYDRKTEVHNTLLRMLTKFRIGELGNDIRIMTNNKDIEFKVNAYKSDTIELFSILKQGHPNVIIEDTSS